MDGVRYKFATFLLSMAIMITIITQLPFFIDHDLNILGVIVWIPILLLLMCSNAIRICRNIYFPVICFLIYILLLLFFNVYLYTYPMFSCVKGFLMSILMFLIGYFFANVLKDEQFVKAVIYAVLIGGLVYAIIINNTVYYIVDLDSITYMYGAKNSASKIIFSCFILVLFLYTPKSKIATCLKCLTLVLFIYIIFIMKSRSTILALLVPVIVVAFYGKNKKYKKSIYWFLFALILLCVCFPDYPVLILNKIILNNQIDADLNTISSGRIWMIQNFSMIFDDYIFIGGSSVFVENFYLKTLLEVGLIGATPVFIFLLWFYFVLKKYFDFSNPIDISCLILLLSYYMDGLFESLAPFGPGAKCFFLWLIIGFFINKRMSNYNRLIF